MWRDYDNRLLADGPFVHPAVELGDSSRRPGENLVTLGGVEILKTLLEADPSVPRLTCYDETTGGRTDLSAQTLDKWAS